MVWVEIRSKYLYTEGGELSYMVGTVRDISDRKKAEEELQSALEHKDQLIREMNHRVHNNLAMIISLIRLKEATMSDAVDLSDIRNQVGAIRSLHEKLQYSEEVSDIEVAPYLEDVVRSAISNGHRPDIELEIAIDQVTLPTKTATNLALIISELVTNAVKHGFGDESKNRLTVSLQVEAGEAQHVLTVSNTGRALNQSWSRSTRTVTGASSGSPPKLVESGCTPRSHTV